MIITLKSNETDWIWLRREFQTHMKHYYNARRPYHNTNTILKLVEETREKTRNEMIEHIGIDPLGCFHVTSEYDMSFKVVDNDKFFMAKLSR